MADSKDPDQSMEDILQSIKRIIADEAEPAPDMPGSDVLELTEMLESDAAVPAVDEPTSNVGSVSIDDLMAGPPPASGSTDIDAPSDFVMESNTTAAEDAGEEESFFAEEAPVAAAPAAAPKAGDRLMSDNTYAASMEALHALANAPHPSTPVGNLGFRSGTTVEDLVLEALKPMLKEWLDGNLPSMVRTLVEREIRRLSA